MIPAEARRNHAQQSGQVQHLVVPGKIPHRHQIQTGGTPQKFQERINKEYERWVKLIDSAGIKPE